ncbi:hypothetical protein CBM2625_A280011 [Cupriavidus taiwanensis]|nr:hypothetical protein CBM2625_A280011 [Cupriavidus taiwanensis]
MADRIDPEQAGAGLLRDRRRRGQLCRAGVHARPDRQAAGLSAPRVCIEKASRDAGFFCGRRLAARVRLKRPRRLPDRY